MNDEYELLIREVEILKNILISRATGVTGSDNSENNSVFLRLRTKLLSNEQITQYTPRFLKTSRNLEQFWYFIQPKFESYKERRAYIHTEFEHLLEFLENNIFLKNKSIPSDEIISLSQGLKIIHSDYINETWTKALERRKDDPEAAITSARSLLETVCKHILDDMDVEYDDKKDDLPKLYKKTAEALNLAPSQHTEDVFKQILGGCTAIIEGLGSIRNKLSDAHGKGIIRANPAVRHAELAVNLSGAVANYLLATWEYRKTNYKTNS